MKVKTGALERQEQDIQKKEMILPVVATDNCRCESFLTDLSLLLWFFKVLFTTCCMAQYQRSSSSRMAHPYMLSQRGFVCLPAQSLGHGGDTRTITKGELDNKAAGRVSFVCRGTGGAQLGPYKMISSRVPNCQK